MKKIFYNGTILTMEKDAQVQAVLTQDGLIEKTGTFDCLRRLAPDAMPVDLARRTMLPAFIDAHSHFSSYAGAQLQLSLDGAASFAEIAARIQAFPRPAVEGDWMLAKGYDHNALAEKAHPDIALLDRLAPHHPLVLQHQSGHCGVFNTRALAALGITPHTPAPAGGVIGCAHGALTGYLEETAYVAAIKQIPAPDGRAMLAAYGRAQEKYLAHGITTVQEGMMVAQMLPLYQGLLEREMLTVDVVGYAERDAMHALRAAFPQSIQKYDRHFKIGGYKIILDGSPQVKTAWMGTPYRGSQSRGYGTMQDDAVFAAVEQATAEGMQLLAHCNGDAAIQQYLDAVQKVAAQNSDVLRLRPVIIHAQLMTQAQLAQAAALHMIPSFFIAHILHWGDIHIENFGYERAKSISPAQSAHKLGLPFTFHQDTPVIEPDMLETIQCAVTRRTRAGVLLDQTECVAVPDALRAVTLHAAYQYGEEDVKGSIKAGKYADFVILDQNPLLVPHDQIASIAVLATIKRGEIVFRAASSAI